MPSDDKAAQVQQALADLDNTRAAGDKVTEELVLSRLADLGHTPPASREDAAAARKAAAGAGGGGSAGEQGEPAEDTRPKGPAPAKTGTRPGRATR